MTADGVRLSAWHVPSANGAAVVLRHGATSTRSNTLDEMVVLARHGYGVLATDARGHGRSGGMAMDWGWLGDLDTAAAVTYLSRRPRRRRAPHRCRGSLVGRRGSPRRSGADPRIRAVIAEGISGRGTVADDDLNLPNDPRRWMNVAQTWIHCFLQMAQAPRGSFRSSRT